MDKDKKVKVEDILRVQQLFKEKFPKVAVGIAELKKQGIVRIEVRASSEEDAKGIPEEFEGFQVSTQVVSASRYAQFKKVMEGNFKGEE